MEAYPQCGYARARRASDPQQDVAGRRLPALMPIQGMKFGQRQNLPSNSFRAAITPARARILSRLLSLYVEYVLRTGFGADAASDTLGHGGGIFRLHDHLEWTLFRTLAAVLAKFLVNKKHSRRICLDRALWTHFGTLSALYTDRNLCLAVFLSDVNTRQVLFSRVFRFVKCLSTGQFTGKTGHASRGVFYRQFLHNQSSQK
jgi:hypothetical protein